MVGALTVRFMLTAAGTLAAGFIAAAPAYAVTPAPGDDPDVSAETTEAKYSPEVVVSATRTARAIDHIPGSVVAISGQDLANIQLSSLDSNQVLAQAIPGYTASMDDLTTSGELLRGKRPQFFLDGVLIPPRCATWGACRPPWSTPWWSIALK